MKRNWNWMLPGGFLLTLGSFIGYFDLFARWPATRDFPWANLPLSAVALYLLGHGLWRAYRHPLRYRGRIFGPVLVMLGLVATGLLYYYIFVFSYQVPASARAPRVGDTMPNLSLLDQSGEPFELAELLPVLGMPEREPETDLAETNEDAPWVLLVFYRGYW